MLTLDQISEFKRNNPDYNSTTVLEYDANNKLVKRIKFPSRWKANEYIRESKADFIEVNYGCN